MALDLESRFPRINLGFWPSPIHPLRRLSNELGIEVWAKRDDVSSGLAFGGNKCASWNGLPPTPWPRGATHWSRSATSSPITRARSRPSPPSWACAVA